MHNNEVCGVKYDGKKTISKERLERIMSLATKNLM